MLNINDIFEMWKKDSKIDDMNLDDATRDAAKMHSKYLEMLTTTKLQEKRLNSQLKKLLKDKWLWYNGKMSKEDIDSRGWEYDPFKGISKPLKGEMDIWYNSDSEISHLNDKLEYLKTIIETLEEIMQTIKWRHQSIRNMIDWRKFTSGG